MTIETKDDAWRTIKKWLFHREKIDLEEEKEIDRVTDPSILDFLKDELWSGCGGFSQLKCEYCSHGLVFQEMGDYYDLWCMNSECLESEMHRVYKEDLG